MVVIWPDGGDAYLEEPARGAHYQPYGPVELSYIIAMIGDLALDRLLKPPSQSQPSFCLSRAMENCPLSATRNCPLLG
jgi:hypothetical protein